MGLQIGYEAGPVGWLPPMEVIVDGSSIASIYTAGENGSLTEMWRKAMTWDQADLSKTIVAPSWSSYIDVVALGGGGGGVRGNGANTKAGRGGDPGKYASVCWVTLPGQEFIISIGAGGAGGVSGNTDGKAGGSTTVKHVDLGYMLTAEGGPRVSGQNDWKTGYSPGNYTYKTPEEGPYRDQTTHYGGGEVGMNQPGYWPGGGGGGGGGGVFNIASDGQPGASGIVWYRFRAY